MGSHFQRLLTTYDKGEVPVEPSGVSVDTFRVRIMNIAVDRGDTSITPICCFIQILLLRQTGCAVLYCTQPAWRFDEWKYLILGHYPALYSTGCAVDGIHPFLHECKSVRVRT